MPLLPDSARPRWSCAILVFAIALVAFLAIAQQPANESESVLRRARDRLLTDLERFPRYTCVQTVTRYYYRPHVQGASCAKLMAEHQSPSKDRLRGWDRLRLEVAVVDHSNVYSWVGAPRFESGTVDQLVRRGPFNTGDFGPFLQSIFGGTAVNFIGQQPFGQRQLLAYAYDVPLEGSKYEIKTADGWTPTAYNGTLVLDPESDDIVLLMVRTAELPKSCSDCQAISQVQYGRIKIHDRMALIPRETSLITLGRDGNETESRTIYSSCREYASKTRLFIDPASATSTAGAIDRAAGFAPRPHVSGTSNPAPVDSTPAALNAAHAPPDFLPPGLHFRARIITPIDSDTAAAGDPIEAVLRDPIRDKNKRELAPTGAHLRGRLLALEQRGGSTEYFRISIQFESIELNGKTWKMRAVPGIGLAIGVGVRDSRVVSGDLAIESTSFFFRKEHLHLDKFDWNWTTTLPLPEDKTENQDGEP